MRCIPPLTITDAMLTSSSVAEPAAGETAWSAATAYTVGQQAIRTSTHRVYQRLVAGTTATAPESDATNWLDVGPTKRWSMFDTLRNSATTSTSNLVVTVTPGQRIDSIALMGIVGSSVTITMTVGASTVYTSTTNLLRRTTLTWSDYYFGTFQWGGSLVKFDLPPYSGAAITVTVNTVDGSAACGAFAIGRSVYMGKAEHQASSEAMNFSTVTRDAFGNATLVPRRTVPASRQTLVAPVDLVDKLRDLRALGNATPMVWSGMDDKDTHYFFESLLMLGVYKEFTITDDNTVFAKVQLALEEI